MTRSKLPPHVYREKTRHGKFVFYFRRGPNGQGPRIRLPDFGAPEFEAAYSAALIGANEPVKKPPDVTASLGWLIMRYRETREYRNLEPATRKPREIIFKQVVEKNGVVPFTEISRKHIRDGRDKRAETPAMARHFLVTMRGLFKWAVDEEHVAHDPTVDVANLKPKEGGGYKPWTVDEIARYLARWPVGTRERVWFAVLFHTGLRREDAIKIGRQHVRQGVATYRPQKTAKDPAEIEVHIPIRQQFAEALEAGPVGDLTWIVGVRGNPLTVTSFGNKFRAACDAAGVEKSAHGLRKNAAEEAALAGATVPQLNAMFGWKGSKMAMHYIEKADRRRLAIAGADKVDNVHRLKNKD